MTKSTTEDKRVTGGSPRDSNSFSITGLTPQSGVLSLNQDTTGEHGVWDQKCEIVPSPKLKFPQF